ncbi:uncharacterized mitochondrial protein AtMg00810-like [Lotus japonicus]|uniref:uncharacterized mitochondrial protein AtMg00810-like n=1 Tax=Lotus japonicus TaxID=34305 RepID=UPI0025878045|nr:uncharacterized mitochondrial protein AtMg00810-like [Lotus japonicus]
MGRSHIVLVDCDETFSLVVKLAIIRAVLTIVLSKSWLIHQFDVQSAFLHGDLHETVYMHQPLGFHVTLWSEARATCFHNTYDHSLCIFRQGSDMTYILMYADDIILITSSHELHKYFMAPLASEFARQDLGPLSYFLGITVSRYVDDLFLSQSNYASKKLLLEPAWPRATLPLLQLTQTRSSVCLHMHAPHTKHMLALKCILHYVQGTMTYDLHLYKSHIEKLVSYTDADWDNLISWSSKRLPTLSRSSAEVEYRRSTFGYCAFLEDNLISWSSKWLPTLSRSSAEVEYKGVANVVFEACWIHNLLLELHFPLHQVTLVYCDNVSVIYLSGNLVQHQRTMHIEMNFHFVREKVARDQTRVLHVPSRHQIVDIFTKGLP